MNERAHDKVLLPIGNSCRGVLKDDASTAELFIWLDANKPETARAVFDWTQNWLLPALVRTKSYGVCGKYIDPDDSFKAALQLYRTMMDHVKQHHYEGGVKEFAEHAFINKITPLIAILVVEGRKTDAVKIAEQITNEPDLPDFKAEIQKALNGEVPVPSP